MRLRVTDALSALAQQQQAGALTMEGFGANRTILDPRLHMARPAAGQHQAAKALHDLLARDEDAGADHPAGSAVDPLHAVDPWRADRGDRSGASAAVEIELNAAADNPLVLGDDGLVLSTGNFHTASLALA